MTHQNTLLTQTQMCPKGFDDEHIINCFHNWFLWGLIKVSDKNSINKLKYIHPKR